MSKLNIKKIAALGCAAAMLSSLTACGEKTTWGAVIDGVRIPAGVFIYYLDSAHYDAQQKLSEQQAAETTADLSPEGAAAQTSETVSLPLFSSQIDGVDAKQWIYDEATKSMQEYAAVEAKFDEYGLTLTDEDKETAQVYLDQIWEYAGEYYTSMGISENSYKSIFLNSSKKQKLFETIYSEGGEKAVSDDEIKTYLDENYALINYIDVELRDGEGNLLKSEGKAERMEMLNSYIERYKNGEDFDELNAEYVTYYDNLKKAAEEAAAKAAEEAANAETAAEETTAEVSQSPAEAPLAGEGDELTDSDEETPAETEAPADEETAEETTAPADEETAEETETSAEETTAPAETAAVSAENQDVTVGAVNSNMTVIEKADKTVPCAEVAEKVFDGMNKGDIEIVETADGEHYYLVLKLDILEDEEYFTTARDSLLSEMKYDEFEGIVTEWTAAQSVSKNDAAYKRYDPEKIFGK
ncbi:hypothetical protein [Huintestinicola sp.]|uniref:hypothetical protein n=1 Tax=Huintestinicola sp. TaxID=2981661 RepID=UPI003D7CD186